MFCQQIPVGLLPTKQATPGGWRIQDVDFAPLIERLSERARSACNVGELKRDENARGIWYEVYGVLSEGKPGLLGSVISRAEAQVMRLSLVYALLDGAPVIHEEHLLAGLAIWEYAEASARYIFGDALGNPMADRILNELRVAREGLTRTEICNIFGRHCTAQEVDFALRLLHEYGLACRTEEKTSGRPIERWFASVPTAKKAT